MEWADFKSSHYGMRSLGMSWGIELGTRGTKKKSTGFCIILTLHPTAQEYTPSQAVLPGRGLSPLSPALVLYDITEPSQPPFKLVIFFMVNSKMEKRKYRVTKTEGDLQPSPHSQNRISDYGPSTKDWAFLGITWNPPYCAFHHQLWNSQTAFMFPSVWD